MNKNNKIYDKFKRKIVKDSNNLSDEESKKKNNSVIENDLEDDETIEEDSIESNDNNDDIESVEEAEEELEEESDQETEFNDDIIDEDNEEENEETMGKKCLSKYTSMIIEDEDNYLPEDDYEVIKMGRISKQTLFRNEFVAIMCVRIKQLAQNAKPMIKNYTGLTNKEIAKLELKNKIIPLKIGRPIPNIGLEILRLKDLYIPEHYYE